MIATSTAFDTAITGSPRKTKSKITFDILDVTAAGDATESATSEASISRITQTTDGIREMSAKYATNENDYTLLDGGFTLPPETTDGSYQVGLWSDALSQADNTYAVSQVLTVDFTSNHSSIGITLTFDKGTNEYADSFTIQAYDSTSTLLDTDTVTGNTLSKYVWTSNLTDYRQIVVTVTKWCKPYRRVRITEIDFGIVEEYTDDNLFSVGLLEELSPTSQEVAANELTYEIDNQDKRFDILNPTGIYSFLQRKQKITTQIGVQTLPGVYEYVNMGIHYLTEWKSNAGTFTATFVALDILDILEKSFWRKSDLANITLENLAIAVFADAEITDYDIDASLASITVKNYMPIVTHRQALQMIAVASESVVYSDRDGQIVIKPLSATPSGKTISLDDVYESPEIQLAPLYNQIDVDIYDFITGASETVYNGTLALTGTTNLWIEYKEPASSVSVGLSSGSLDAAVYYTNAAYLTITATGNITITATGNKVELAKSPYQLVDPSIPAGELASTLKVDNTLINGSAVATSVASWILAENNKRKLYNINWRQNPAFETGDVVTVEDDYSVDDDTTITRQEFNFAGYLSGSSNSKGVS